MTSNTDDPARDEPLVAVRDAIDQVDQDLLALLNRRAALSLEVGRLKAGSDEPVFKPFREKEVLEKLARENPGPLPDEHLRSIYREIMSSSRRLQRTQKVAYLGPEGTFSYFAAVSYLGRSSEFTPQPGIPEVFEAVHLRDAELGVIPLENSLQGTVGQSLDLFLRHEVFIQSELYCKISHALLSKGSDLSRIEEIYSHPQPLAQCGGWLKAHLPMARIIPAESTAAAARRVLYNPKAAAVGHVKLSEMLGLNVLASRIEDLPDNWTRFLVIGPAETKTGNRDKTSILFTLPDKPGSLSAVLNRLAVEGINLTKLESRPLRGEKWKYVFFADLQCDLGRDEFKTMLEQLRQELNSLRILGSYPTGPHLDVSGSAVLERA
ncbi:P-protein [Fundidesulfovibrio magnetotacticus]|uniref:Bifunctional chorismate mutase/prephenate dehydratase n=1 Tax=Fundidesulfovibrio magnetotacticus TaxID=2730080 RepID=A0A6V8LMS4_9BACT|nr:prephenate dehydratase [Fundidesulfovibrio magnetotacticus]GFK93972.1 P-protein [Fundidesulfovibrio magnetotacticus]